MYYAFLPIDTRLAAIDVTVLNNPLLLILTEEPLCCDAQFFYRSCNDNTSEHTTFFTISNDTISAVPIEMSSPLCYELVFSYNGSYIGEKVTGVVSKEAPSTGI